MPVYLGIVIALLVAIGVSVFARASEARQRDASYFENWEERQKRKRTEAYIYALRRLTGSKVMMEEVTGLLDVDGVSFGELTDELHGVCGTPVLIVSEDVHQEWKFCLQCNSWLYEQPCNNPACKFCANVPETSLPIE